VSGREIGWWQTSLSLLTPASCLSKTHHNRDIFPANTMAYDNPASWRQLDPKGKLVQWGGGPVGGILCSGGGGRWLTAKGIKMVGGTWALVTHFLRVHTLALWTLTRTNCRFVSPSIWVFQWDWWSISPLEPLWHAGECARAVTWRTGCWCPTCHKSMILFPTPELGKQEVLVRRSDQKLKKRGN